MKPFLYRLVTVFLLLCAACTEAEIVLPGSGGDDSEKGVPFRVKNLGMWMEVESRSVVTGGPGETNRNPNPLTGIGICVTKQNSSGTEILYNNAVGSQQFVYNPGRESSSLGTGRRRGNASFVFGERDSLWLCSGRKECFARRHSESSFNEWYKGVGRAEVLLF